MEGTEATASLESEIAECPLLKDLEPAEREHLLKMSAPKSFTANNPVIFKEGDVGDGFYIILSGQVRISKMDSKGNEHLLSSLSAGDFFGEMALFDDEIRSATAESLEPVQVLWISRRDFDTLLSEGSSLAAKILFKMTMDLSNRMRLLNERYVYIKSTYTGARFSL